MELSIHRETARDPFLHPERNTRTMACSQLEKRYFGFISRNPWHRCRVWGGSFPSFLLLPWDGTHCSCLLNQHRLFRDTGIWDHPAVMLLMFIHQHLQLQLSLKNIHGTKSRFPPPSRGCCGSGQVSASHFLLERGIFWEFLDVVNEIMPHFG